MLLSLRRLEFPPNCFAMRVNHTDAAVAWQRRKGAHGSLMGWFRQGGGQFSCKSLNGVKFGLFDSSSLVFSHLDFKMQIAEFSRCSPSPCLFHRLWWTQWSCQNKELLRKPLGVKPFHSHCQTTQREPRCRHAVSTRRGLFLKDHRNTSGTSVRSFN